MYKIILKNKNITIHEKNNNIFLDSRFKRKVMCSCTGNTEKTATPFVISDGEIFCPNCGEKAKIIKTPQDFEDEKIAREKEALDNLHLRLVAHDWECGFNFYGLSTRIPLEKWNKVKHLFNWNYWHEDLDLDFGTTKGWTTFEPMEVQEILKDMIKDENRIEIE